ncbi:MAG: DUF3084 domain-containing protein [Synergistaceae bacterium]|nr:DUF3084 domain-containing protein [Synergistaceae bacterium]
MQPQVWTDTNWTLIVLIIAGSAILAYAGDVLGSKYGKQRISIFGLRPRLTSRLITAFTGMFISVVVLASLSFFSENVRTALFRMKALQQETVQLTHQLQATALSLDITRFGMETLQKDRDMLFNEKNDLEAMTSSLRDEAGDLRRNLDVMRLGAITVQANSLLAQRVILPGASRDTLSEIMAALEGNAREEVAVKRSERRHTVSDDVVLVIDPKEGAEFAARAANYPERLYVRVLAVENTALDEVVTVRLESGISYLLYNEGETVHRKLVRPEESGFNAEEALHVFLRELRSHAIRNGVRPDPATYSVGSLEGEDFFDTVEALRSMKTPTIINAVALQEIYTEGPVRIKILLEQ